LEPPDQPIILLERSDVLVILCPLTEQTRALIGAPHMAWVSDQSMKILADQLIGNLEAFVASTPQNLVL
jgi:lactate dehydrogenase-like 2-hydroxyacid dehydrogenase